MEVGWRGGWRGGGGSAYLKWDKRANAGNVKYLFRCFNIEIVTVLLITYLHTYLLLVLVLLLFCYNDS